MDFDVHGHPLHSRALGITLTHRADGRIDAAGSLLDLRKRGFVPVGGDLQSSGIVHHMLLDLVVDPATGRVDEAGGPPAVVGIRGVGGHRRCPSAATSCRCASGGG